MPQFRSLPPTVHHPLSRLLPGEGAVALTITLWVVFLLLAVVPATPVLASERLSDADIRLYREAFQAANRNRWDDAKRLAAQTREKLPAKALMALELARPDSGAGFEPLDRFLREHAEWPGLAAIRRQAEMAMPADMPYAAVRAWFGRQPPQTLNGLIRLADALMATGADDQVPLQVRQRWIDGGYGPAEEQEFLARFAGFLRPEDHAARLDRLIWDGQDVAARRMYPLVDDERQAVAEARLLLAAEARGAESALGRVPEALRLEPGLLYERIRRLRRQDQDSEAARLLQKAPAELPRPALWWTERQLIARRLLRGGDGEQAYRLAREHGQSEGTGLVEAEFLAGWIALRHLKKPETAREHFQVLTRRSSSPISQARGYYWLARAAEAARDGDEARQYDEKAASYGTVFYGQLAAARLGQEVRLPVAAETGIDREEQIRFEKREMVRLTRLLAQIEGNGGERSGLFARRIGSLADKPEEYALAGRLALSIGRPDIAIAIAKQAVQSGHYLLEAGYPQLSVDLPSSAADPALVLALIRQESMFNSGAVSPVGARGLMQLMPATAQMVAGKLGLKELQSGRLTSDPGLNVRLGTRYLEELLGRFQGSTMLAVASYNAGERRVREWMGSNGDPRRVEADIIDWIESIPFSETRNYVQRVLEGMMVYRARRNGGVLAASLEQELRR